MVAETGGEGLALAFEHHPDLVLPDISLPDIDGNMVLKQLRDHPQTASTPVIAISGNAVAVTPAESPGFQAYLSKPIDIQTFYSTIDSLLQSPA